MKRKQPLRAGTAAEAPPSLDKLAEGYVNSHFDLPGGAPDIIEAASQLAHTRVPMRGRFGRILGTVRHNRAKLMLKPGDRLRDIGSGSTPLGAANCIEKYVFPHGELPRISRALRGMQTAGLGALDVECLRRHYARTLTLWAQNYERHGEALQGRCQRGPQPDAVVACLHVFLTMRLNPKESCHD